MTYSRRVRVKEIVEYILDEPDDKGGPRVTLRKTKIISEKTEPISEDCYNIAINQAEMEYSDD